jgi:hypothetical protein
MKSSAPLTILAMPKPFAGHIGVIQRNAIMSWTRLRPRPEIYLFGEETGVAEIASEAQIHHLHDIDRSEFGTPLLNDLLRRSRQFVTTPLLCYVNSDVILLQEFLDGVVRIQRKFPKFLAVAHRLNVDLAEAIDFAADGEQTLRGRVLPRGESGNHTAIDVFVFPPNVYEEVPPLAIGRAWFDQWLIKDALRQKVPVVDVTKVARAIHQNHEYAHIAGGQQGAYWGEEARRSLAIYGGVPHAFTLLDVTHELLPNGSFRRVRFRRRRAELKEWIWRRLIVPTSPFRQRLGLRRAAPQKTDKNRT